MMPESEPLRTMEIDELKKMKQFFITPAVAAKYIQCDPQWIRLMARQRPEQLGFPVLCVKSRVKIPRIPFISYLLGSAYDTRTVSE